MPQPSGGGGGGGGTSDAIGKLRDASETLDKRQEHLMRKIDNEVKMARDFSQKGKKREALTCIKRKKMYEKQLEQVRRACMPQTGADGRVRNTIRTCSVDVAPLLHEGWGSCAPRNNARVPPRADPPPPRRPPGPCLPRTPACPCLPRRCRSREPR